MEYGKSDLNQIYENMVISENYKIDGYEIEDDDIDREFYNEEAYRIIKQRFGKPNSYSGSADWGGMPVWTIKGDKFTGDFLVVADDGVVYMNRKLVGKNQDEYKDTDMRVAKTFKELYSLLDSLEK